MSTMNDPHVEKLFYVVDNDDWLDYGSAEAPPEEEGFRLLVEDKMVCFEMKEHYPTVAAAREVIDSYVCRLGAGYRSQGRTWPVPPAVPLFQGRGSKSLASSSG